MNNDAIDFFLTEEHKMFRETVRDFAKQYIEPNFDKWEKEGKVDREFFKKAGEFGLLGLAVEPEYAGMGLNHMYSLVMVEELGKHNFSGATLSLVAHSYLGMNYLQHAGTDYIKKTYLEPSVTGEKVSCLGMTEPGAGSDLAALSTTAVREGDYYIVNGSKTFITNGVYADFMVTAVKTDPSKGPAGVSLLVIDCNSEGFTRSKLHKLGMHSSDTAEIGMTNVKVPVANLLGQEGMGFKYMMESLQTERLGVAWACMGEMIGVFNKTIDYMNTRVAFGKPITKFQALRHKLAEMAIEIEATRAFLYLTNQRFCNGDIVVTECSMLKAKTSDLLNEVSDKCLQMFGGYGFIEEYPVARIYRDQRVNPIYAGTNEIMKEIICKTVVDGVTYKKVYN
ncbi:MAG: acyl-CoA dehydrogenase [Flavobacteriaceae bacterium]|nr:MAG: acyl-CoA dehydrogenase [Flavobacteriaceae bacterium]